MKITQSKFKNGKPLQFGDINVFVGPNGVGKTTLMNEIREFFCQGSSSTSYWVTGLENSNLEPDEASILLRYIKKNTEVNDRGEEIKKYTLSHNKNNIGTYQSHNDSDIYSEDAYKKLVLLSENKKSGAEDIQLPNRYFTHRIFIGYEDTRQRLGLEGERLMTDSKNPLNDIINVIVRNENFRTSLDKVFFKCFGYHLFFSSHRGAIIEILASKTKPESIKELSVKTFDEAEEIKKDKGVFTIDKVGDGMRAGAKLFFSLFNPDSKIIFIDEPEVFIHPKQKINISKELKNLVKKNKKQLFLSTHDATFLSGLIDNREDKIEVDIFYVKDHKKIIPLEKFSVSDDKITPATKQQKYLQSLFYDGTIFVEGPNDRCFYENTVGEIFRKELSKKDIVFTDVGGASRAIEVAKFLVDSELKAVFIFDNDVITSKKKNQKLPKIYKALGGEKDLKIMLENLSGVNGKKTKENIIKELEIYGIFIVPNGELESWGSYNKNSDGFPYNLIKEMITDPNKDFKIFVSKILKFLTKTPKK
ncbi:ATP-binding protein [Candidatus Parcubacteria bacterium]|nr:ATP-binding protein [Candidatus Parcubacteria bacterium]